MGEIVDLDRLLRSLETRRQEKKVVFTNGCFDLLHAGHVDYLQKAKDLGDILVVGINDDASVAGLKGPGRPIIPHDQRLKVVAALASVDYVVGFSEATPIELISQLKPDIHVKGGDYRESDLPESKVVKAYGGRVVIMPFLDNISTTAIISKISRL